MASKKFHIIVVTPKQEKFYIKSVSRTGAFKTTSKKSEAKGYVSEDYVFDDIDKMAIYVEQGYYFYYE